MVPRERAGCAPAIGIASFGPLDLDRASPTWGHITRTPKPHWSGADLVGPFADAFGCPVAIDTDVNGAALSEHRWGAGVGHGSLLYLTVGTGIGGGFVGKNGLLHGLSHPRWAISACRAMRRTTIMPVSAPSMAIASKG
jgi:fructokinase